MLKIMAYEEQVTEQALMRRALLQYLKEKHGYTSPYRMHIDSL